MATNVLSDPVRFAHEVLGHKTTKIQEQILRAVVKHPRVAVKGCHASGKSFTASELVLFWLHRYANARVLVVAPSFRQVGQVIWTEVHRAASKISLPPGAKLLQTELRFSDSCYAIGLTAKNHSAFAGYHADNTLIIADESPGIDQDIFEGAEGCLAGGNSHLLLLGNPTLSSGPFFDAFHRNRSLWKTFTISAMDTPNMEGVTLERLLGMSDKELDDDAWPMLCPRRWILDHYKTWFNGTAEQSPLWQSRVLGQFPMQSEFALYWLSWIENASRPRENEIEQVYAGVDPSGPGKDETAVCITSNGAILETGAFTAADSRGQVVEFLNRWRDRLRLVRIDEGGVGYGWMLHLRDCGFVVEGVNFGASAKAPERFGNAKAEAYWRLREELQAGRISGMVDGVTQEQAASVLYDLDGAGRVQIESKEAARRRGVKSPDRLEALILALPPATWSAAGIQLIPSMSSGRYDPTDPRHAAAAKLASGKGEGGFRLGSQQRKDLEEDARPRVRASEITRRVHRGTFYRSGW